MPRAYQWRISEFVWIFRWRWWRRSISAITYEYDAENVLVDDNEENYELDLDLLDLEDIENTDLYGWSV